MYDSNIRELPRETNASLTRREFIHAGLAAGGALVVGFHLPLANAVQSAKTPFAPNAYIRIDRDGKVTLIMPQVEMGQGIYTSCAMILAEELDAAFDTVSLEAAPPNDKLYANPVFGIQATGNSNSVRAWWKPLRAAGASTRAMLVQAAARQWQVDPASCTTANSEVMHK